MRYGIETSYKGRHGWVSDLMRRTDDEPMEWASQEEAELRLSIHRSLGGIAQLVVLTEDGSWEAVDE